MNDLACLAPAVLGGGALGAVFFGGLWWTVRRGIGSSAPALWFLGSLLLRTGVVVVGFYAISRGDLSRLACCTFGFLAVRTLATRRAGRSRGSALPSARVIAP